MNVKDTICEVSEVNYRDEDVLIFRVVLSLVTDAFGRTYRYFVTMHIVIHAFFNALIKEQIVVRPSALSIYVSYSIYWQ